MGGATASRPVGNSSPSLKEPKTAVVGAPVAAWTGKDFQSLSVAEWSVQHVCQWVMHTLAPTLDGGSQPYAHELCTELEACSISGPLLLYLGDEAKLQLQLQLDSQRWAARAPFVADAIRQLADASGHTLQQAAGPNGIASPGAVRLPAPHGTALSTNGARQPDSKLATTPKSTASDKPYIVISYATQQASFKDWLVGFIEDSLGIEAWSGSDVLAGGGAGYWAEQWIRRADSDSCVMIIFILSRAFAQSAACKKEFAYVFGGRKANQVLPIMYELFELPQWINFNLADVNYMAVTPINAHTTCTCSAKCECTTDCRATNPALAPTSDWHAGLLVACMDIAKLSTGQPVALAAEPSKPGSIKRLMSVKAATPPEMTLEERRDGLMKDIAGSMGMDLGKLKMVGIIGSTSFFYKDTERICQLIGHLLARLPSEYCLVTGGFHGVGEAISKAFHEVVGGDQRLFHVLPKTDPQLEGVKDLTECTLTGKAPLEVVDGVVRFAEKAFGFGKVLRVGSSIRERESIMACLPVLLLLEGGPGATNEAKSATKSKKYVVPVGVTGGAASTFHQEGVADSDIVVRVTGMRSEWTTLGDPDASVEAIAQAAVDLVRRLHDKVVGRERRLELPEGSERNKPERLMVLPDLSEFLDKSIPSADAMTKVQLRQLGKYLSKFDGAYMLNGHGAKNQYRASESEMFAVIKPIVVALNQKHGPGKWCCCYGGDPYQPDAPDVAHFAHLLHSEGVTIVAVQCDEYMDSILKPSHRAHYSHLAGGAALFYSTTFAVDNNGLKHIQFGGKRLNHDGSMVLVGWSRVMFAKEVISNIKGLLVLGGGSITRDDCEECIRQQVPIYYVRMEARNRPLAHTSAGSYYGEIDEWMHYRGFQQRTWILG